MVFVQTDFEELVRVSRTQFQTYGFERALVPRGENLPPVLYWTDEMEHNERFVVGFTYVPCLHLAMLTLAALAAKLTRYEESSGVLDFG